jgi:hypothetical protein
VCTVAANRHREHGTQQWRQRCGDEDRAVRTDAAQRHREQWSGGQPAVVGQPQMAQRPAAGVRTAQLQQPQHPGGHHRALADPDEQACADQYRRRRNSQQCRAAGHHQGTGKHHPDRSCPIGPPARQRPDHHRRQGWLPHHLAKAASAAGQPSRRTHERRAAYSAVRGAVRAGCAASANATSLFTVQPAVRPGTADQ